MMVKFRKMDVLILAQAPSSHLRHLARLRNVPKKGNPTANMLRAIQRKYLLALKNQARKQ